MTINVLCYDEGIVYIDGGQAGRMSAMSLELQRTVHPRLLAVKCTRTTSDYGGLLVSTSSGVTSDELWTVKTSYSNDWYKTVLDTTNGWTTPQLIGNNTQPPHEWPQRDGFIEHAQWIWTLGDHKAHQFRRTIGNLVVVCRLYNMT